MTCELERVNAGSTSILTVRFTDTTGALVAPASAQYRIDSVESGVQVRDWTAMAAGSEVPITLTEADNTMLSTRAVERREVTVVGVYGGGQITNRYRYEIEALRFYP